MPPASKENSN